jgi:hypothetical protein
LILSYSLQLFPEMTVWSFILSNFSTIASHSNNDNYDIYIIIINSLLNTSNNYVKSDSVGCFSLTVPPITYVLSVFNLCLNGENLD